MSPGPLFEQIVQNTKDGIAVYDLNALKMIYINPAFQRLFSMNIDEINQNPELILSRIHPDDREVFKQNLLEIATGLSDYNEIEYRFQINESEFRWLSDHRTLIRSEFLPSRIVSITQDISQQKLNEQLMSDIKNQMTNIIETLPGVVLLIHMDLNRKTKIEYISQNIENLFGLKAQDLINNYELLYLCIYPLDAKNVADQFQKSLTSLKPFEIEFRIAHPIKGEQWIWANVLPEREHDHIKYFAYMRDISFKKYLAIELDQERELINETFNSIQDALFITTKDGKLLLNNKTLNEWLDRSNLSMLPLQELVHLYDSSMVEIKIDSYPKGDNVFSFNKTERFVRLTTRILSSESVMYLLRDVTQEILQENITQAFMAVNQDLLCVIDSNGIILRTNSMFQIKFGYLKDALVGTSFMDWFNKNDQENLRQVFNRLEYENDFIEFESQKISLNHEILHLSWHIKKGLNSVLYASAKDVTKEFQEKTRLEYAAHHDVLSGLYNRTYLKEWFSKINQHTSYQPLSMILFDIDHFKNINDTYGHSIGDRCIQFISHFVSQKCLDNNLLFRIGGEEFLILSHSFSLDEAIVLTQELQTTLYTHKDPILPRLSCSFGVSQQRVNESFENWVERTDRLMYHSKEKGRNQVTYESN